IDATITKEGKPYYGELEDKSILFNPFEQYEIAGAAAIFLNRADIVKDYPDVIVVPEEYWQGIRYKYTAEILNAFINTHKLKEKKNDSRIEEAIKSQYLNNVSSSVISVDKNIYNLPAHIHKDGDIVSKSSRRRKAIEILKWINESLFELRGRIVVDYGAGFWPFFAVEAAKYEANSIIVDTLPDVAMGGKFVRDVILGRVDKNNYVYGKSGSYLVSEMIEEHHPLEQNIIRSNIDINFGVRLEDLLNADKVGKNTVSVLWAGYVLIMIGEDEAERAMKEIYDALAPGGIFIADFKSPEIIGSSRLKIKRERLSDKEVYSDLVRAGFPEPSISILPRIPGGDTLAEVEYIVIARKPGDIMSVAPRGLPPYPSLKQRQLRWAEHDKEAERKLNRCYSPWSRDTRRGVLHSLINGFEFLSPEKQIEILTCLNDLTEDRDVADTASWVLSKIINEKLPKIKKMAKYASSSVLKGTKQSSIFNLLSGADFMPGIFGNPLYISDKLFSQKELFGVWNQFADRFKPAFSKINRHSSRASASSNRAKVIRFISYYVETNGTYAHLFLEGEPVLAANLGFPGILSLFIDISSVRIFNRKLIRIYFPRFIKEIYSKIKTRRNLRAVVVRISSHDGLLWDELERLRFDFLIAGGYRGFVIHNRSIAGYEFVNLCFEKVFVSSPAGEKGILSAIKALETQTGIPNFKMSKQSSSSLKLYTSDYKYLKQVVDRIIGTRESFDWQNLSKDLDWLLHFYRKNRTIISDGLNKAIYSLLDLYNRRDFKRLDLLEILGKIESISRMLSPFERLLFY
ncbi:MAG: hypothetical protein DRH10_09350, partial [Deltaproteobacteria bacterium]